MRPIFGKNRGDRTGKPKLKGISKKGLNNKPKKGKGLGKPKKGRSRPPLDPTAPLDAKQFRREVRQTTNQQIRPLANQIRSEQRGSLVRQNQEIPAWFQDYQQKVSGAQAATAGAYQQAGAQWGDYLKQADTQDTAARDKVNAGAQADAQLRGANVSTLASDQAANAAARRADMGAVGGGTMAKQGANQYAYLQDKQRIGAREEVDQRLQESKRRSKVDTDMRELMREKGELRTKVKQDLRTSERDYRIQNKAFKSKSGYNRAIQNVAKTGLKGEKVSAAAQQNVAGTYAGAKLGAAQTNLQGIKAQNKGGVKKQKLKNKGIKSLPSGGAEADVSGSTDIAYAGGKLTGILPSAKWAKKKGYKSPVAHLASHKADAVNVLISEHGISKQAALAAVNNYVKKHGAAPRRKTLTTKQARAATRRGKRRGNLSGR